MGLFAMSIVEMQEYARKKNIELPLDASKSEILEIILPYQLDDTSMMDIKNIALRNYIKLPTSKNKEELVANAFDSYILICKHANYDILFNESLRELRSSRSYSKYQISDNYRYHNTTAKDIAELIKSVNRPSDMPSENKYASTILSKPVYIKNYLLHLIHLESELDFLKKYLSSLDEHIYQCGTNKNAVKKICEKYMQDKTAYEAYDLCGRLEMLQYMKENPTKYIAEQASIIDDNGVKIENPKYQKLSKPKAPIPPIAPRTQAPVPPKEPNYAKPTLFNRKKVLADNEILKKKYEAELSKYNPLFKKYQDEQQRYSKAMADYQAKRNEYEKALSEYNLKLDEQKKQAKIFAEAAAKLGKEQSAKAISSEIKSTEAEINAITNRNKEESDNILASMLEVVIYNFLCDERKKARKELKETQKALNEMYAYNVVYQKYRELPILTTLYEYINSGRCFDLRGGDGAYNLYESELRANIIFDKLDNISASLESIKANQRMLYTELTQVNNNLEIANQGIFKVVNTLSSLDKKVGAVNKKLSTMNESLESIEKSTKTTAQNTSIAARNSEITAHNSSVTAYNTQVTAYNSAISAQYSRISASRLDSIEFMMAFG